MIQVDRMKKYVYEGILELKIWIKVINEYVWIYTTEYDMFYLMIISVKTSDTVQCHKSQSTGQDLNLRLNG